MKDSVLFFEVNPHVLYFLIDPRVEDFANFRVACAVEDVINDGGFDFYLRIGREIRIQAAVVLIVVDRTASEIRFVRVVFEAGRAVGHGNGGHVLGRGGEHHRFVGLPPVVLDFGNEEEVVAHASEHTAFVARVDFSVVVVGDLSDNGSARGTGIDEVRVFAIVELL